MIEHFQAVVGARIKEFQSKMKEVDREIKKAATGATVNVGASVSEFMRKIRTVDSEMKKVDKNATVDIKARIIDFQKKYAQVKAKMLDLSRDKVVIPIEARINKFQQTIGRIASNLRAFQELSQNTMKGSLISISPSVVPILSSIAGLLGSIGPMIGTIAGSTFALGSAFGLAGIGAGAFGAVAVTNLKSVFKAAEDVKKLQEKLQNETDGKKRAEILAKIAGIQGSLNEEQIKAYESMNKLKKTWSDLATSFEKPTLQIFTQFLDIMGSSLVRLTPLFEGSVKAVQNLTNSLATSMNGEQMTAFFDYLNKSGGPMLELMGKAFGNFSQGLMSMMVAFGPLTDKVANGFLQMSSNFADWAAGLKSSDKFQAFMQYTAENIPKINAIFRDAFAGITYFFAAFGPLSADMMTSLQNMMDRFKEWSKGLSENQGFQNFILYIRENAPRVIVLIGNLTSFLVNMGIALAPMGSWLLDVINKIIAWTNSMMESHPWIGKIIALVIVLGGALLAAVPNIIAFGTLFSGLGPIFSGLATKVFPLVSKAFGTLSGWLIKLGPIILNVASKILPWLIRGIAALTGPIGLVIGIVISLGVVIYKNWDKIKEVTAKVFGWVKNFLNETWPAILKTVTAYVLKIFITARDKFNDMKNAIRDKMVESVKTVAMKIAEMPGKVRSGITAMISAGKDLIGGVITGITSKISDAYNAVTNFGKNLASKFKNAIDVNSPSRVFANISKWIPPGVAQGIEKTSSVAIKSVASLSNSVSKAFAPQLATIDVGQLGGFDATQSKAFKTELESKISTMSDDQDDDKGDLVLNVDGNELARIQRDRLDELNGKKVSLKKYTRGRKS